MPEYRTLLNCDVR